MHRLGNPLGELSAPFPWFCPKRHEHTCTRATRTGADLSGEPVLPPGAEGSRRPRGAERRPRLNLQRGDPGTKPGRERGPGPGPGAGGLVFLHGQPHPSRACYFPGKKKIKK